MSIDLDLKMSKVMGWEVHEGMYGIFSLYFVVKEPKNITGYTTRGINQDHHNWKPSTNISQAIRVADKAFTKYHILKNGRKCRCFGTHNGCIFKGKAAIIERAICLAIAEIPKESYCQAE